MITSIIYLWIPVLYDDRLIQHVNDINYPLQNHQSFDWHNHPCLECTTNVDLRLIYIDTPIVENVENPIRKQKWWQRLVSSIFDTLFPTRTVCFHISTTSSFLILGEITNIPGRTQTQHSIILLPTRPQATTSDFCSSRVAITRRRNGQKKHISPADEP